MCIHGQLPLNNNNDSTHLMAFFQDNQVSWHQKGRTILDFNKARDNEVAMASDGQHANHLHLAPDRYHTALHHLVSTGWMLFLMPKQQCQSIES